MIFDWSYLSQASGEYRHFSQCLPCICRVKLTRRRYSASILGPATVVILVATPWPVEPIYPAFDRLVLFLLLFAKKKEGQIFYLIKPLAKEMCVKNKPRKRACFFKFLFCSIHIS